MDEFCFQRASHVPAFGSWECYGDLPFTQCFESATQAGLFRYTYSDDRDLYVAGDLYQNDVCTPAMIVVPRHTGKKGCSKEKEVEKGEANWVGCDCECEYKRGGKIETKAVDEDLYKISPHLLRQQPKRKRGWGGLLSSCLRPTCVC